MVPETRLETNRSGVFEIRWTERDQTGRGRTRSVSTRTKDRGLAETVRASFNRAEGESATKERQVLVGDIFDGYIRSLVSRGTTTESVNTTGRVSAFFGGFSVMEITQDVIAEFRATRDFSDATARRQLSCLVAALNWGVKRGMIDRAPFIELPPEGQSKAAFLDEDVEAEVFAAASGDLDKDGRLSRAGRFICLALDTGARRGAISGLTWDRVDMERRTADLRDPLMRLTKKRRVVTPITTRLMPVIERAFAERTPARPGLYLSNAGQIACPFSTFMRKYGFSGITPHVLRHTRITLLLRAGVPVWDVSALVGASPDVIHNVYGHHVADDRLRAQANRRA